MYIKNKKINKKKFYVKSVNKTKRYQHVFQQ